MHISAIMVELEGACAAVGEATDGMVEGAEGGRGWEEGGWVGAGVVAGGRRPGHIINRSA